MSMKPLSLIETCQQQQETSSCVHLEHCRLPIDHSTFQSEKMSLCLKYVRHPALKPSMQGFRAINVLENKTLPSGATSVSISTTLPGDLFSTSALKLYSILKVFAQSPYSSFIAFCFAFHTVV